MDWLLPQNSGAITTTRLNEVGNMSNPVYGIFLLALIAIGLVSHDGFLGFSYLACLFVKGVKPSDLSMDSSLDCPKKVLLLDQNPKGSRNQYPAKQHSDKHVDDEIDALLRKF
jgi:hypothetical protein